MRSIPLLLVSPLVILVTGCANHMRSLEVGPDAQPRRAAVQCAKDQLRRLGYDWYAGTQTPFTGLGVRVRGTLEDRMHITALPTDSAAGDLLKVTATRYLKTARQFEERKTPPMVQTEIETIRSACRSAAHVLGGA